MPPPQLVALLLLEICASSCWFLSFWKRNISLISHTCILVYLSVTYSSAAASASGCFASSQDVLPSEVHFKLVLTLYQEKSSFSHYFLRRCFSRVLYFHCFIPLRRCFSRILYFHCFIPSLWKKPHTYLTLQPNCPSMSRNSSSYFTANHLSSASCSFLSFSIENSHT